MKQLSSSKLGKEYDKAVYCHFDYLIYIYSTHMYTYIYMYSTHMYRNARLDESQAGIKIAGRNINFRYADDTTQNAEIEVELKSLLMRVRVKKLA